MGQRGTDYVNSESRMTALVIDGRRSQRLPVMPSGGTALARNRYERHNEAVRRYFASSGRQHRLLQLCVETEGSSGAWAKLCAFLKVPVPPLPFPHVNKRHSRPTA